ncbi:MAG: 50S ribosomal protein L5 [Planctomycetota bacterium]
MTAVATTTRERYEEAVSQLCDEYSIGNRLAAPRITKVCLNMGVGRAIQDNQILNIVSEHLTQLAGQRAVITMAKKSIAQFRSRQGMKIGTRVTLRRERMWDFLDRLINIAIPRIRDFRGISPKGFDRQGNFSMGLGEQALFPEVNLERMEHNQGLDISVVIANSDREKSLKLMRSLGMPLQKR